MAEDSDKLKLKLIAINTNEQIKKVRTFGDRLADRVTAWSGSTVFLALNVIWFIVWILLNTGVFGKPQIFDEYPFGFLTLVVSLEAIILSIFVLISQNRQAKRSEIRSELEYIADLQADVEITTIMSILERLAAKQDIDISDLIAGLSAQQRQILKQHPISKEDKEEYENQSQA
jgi:uncharacterized membrane protein